MSKGSKQRPTDHENYSNNYDAIFGKKEKRKEPYKQTCSRCGKTLWLDPEDVYSAVHTCTPKEESK
jgi:hypothetical protein